MWDRIKLAFEDGIILAIKFALVIVIIFFTLNYLTNIVQMSKNGNDAAAALSEYINKGYLPKFPIQPKQ